MQRGIILFFNPQLGPQVQWQSVFAYDCGHLRCVSILKVAHIYDSHNFDFFQIKSFLWVFIALPKIKGPIDTWTWTCVLNSQLTITIRKQFKITGSIASNIGNIRLFHSFFVGWDSVIKATPASLHQANSLSPDCYCLLWHIERRGAKLKCLNF